MIWYCCFTLWRWKFTKSLVDNIKLSAGWQPVSSLLIVFTRKIMLCNLRNSSITLIHQLRCESPVMIPLKRAVSQKATYFPNDWRALEIYLWIVHSILLPQLPPAQCAQRNKHAYPDIQRLTVKQNQLTGSEGFVVAQNIKFFHLSLRKKWKAHFNYPILTTE